MPLHLSWQPEEAHREVSRARSSSLLPRVRDAASDRKLAILRGEKKVPALSSREVGLFIFLVKCGQSLISKENTAESKYPRRPRGEHSPGSTTTTTTTTAPCYALPLPPAHPCSVLPAKSPPPLTKVHPRRRLGAALPPATLLRILFLCHGDGLDQRVHLHHVCDEPPAPGVGVGEGPGQALGRVRGRVTG